MSIKVDENTKKLWGEHVSSGYLMYPNENLTRLIYKNRSKIKKILDFGCGDGRHVEMMGKAKIPFLIGVDINDSVLAMSKKRCEDYGFDFKGYNNTDKSLKELLGDERVDCVVSWGIFHINTMENLTKILPDMASVLNEDGLLIANWRTRDDSLYGAGKEISKDTFLIDNDTHGGFVYFFPSLEEIKDLYAKSGFEIQSIDKEEWSTDGSRVKNSFYMIVAKKKN